ncbi:MAG: multidrug efflux MFS transporter [Kiritimatiellaeota bacterium]|nr:multidrug efflux MFS transporter [Kiritimatiellota bacterium]
MPHWRRNLAVVWTAQFVSIMGFSLALPFVPYYIQELGVTDPKAVKFWAALAASSSAFSFALTAPFWGMLADRYGRKPMMLRANLAAALVVGLMAFVPNVRVLVLLRFIQGALTGTVTASTTLVAGNTPEHRQGTALGALSAAVFSGATIGIGCGGLAADLIGYRQTFLIAACLLLAASLIIWLGVREQFVRPAPAPALLPRKLFRLPVIGAGAPIFVLLGIAAMARRFDGPFFPLLVQQLNGGIQGAAKWTGGIGAAAGAGAMLAAVVLGRLSDRLPARAVAGLSATGAGLFMFLTGLVTSLVMLLPVRFLTVFFAAGLDPVLNAWLSRATPAERRGVVFGWSVTVKSSGWMVAPLLSGLLAVHYGLQSIFFVGPVSYLALLVALHLLRRRLPGKSVPGDLRQ